MTTIYLISGPTSALGSTLHVALAGAGLTDVLTPANPGMAPGHETRWSGDRHPDGSIVSGTGAIVPIDPGYPVSFLRGDGPDEVIDKVSEAVEPFGWRLRSAAKRVGDATRVEPDGEG
jgi:hypothetical protein